MHLYMCALSCMVEFSLSVTLRYSISGLILAFKLNMLFVVDKGSEGFSLSLS